MIAQALGAGDGGISAKRLVRLDILVNNAGIMVLAAIDQFKVDDFDRMLAVNVRAPYFAIQAAARHMGPGGRAITIGSIVADRHGVEPDDRRRVSRLNQPGVDRDAAQTMLVNTCGVVQTTIGGAAGDRWPPPGGAGSERGWFKAI